jgi:hypothetical protein
MCHGVITLSIECHYAERCYAECDIFIVMLSMRKTLSISTLSIMSK